MPSTLGVTFRGDGASLELSWPSKSLLENGRMSAFQRVAVENSRPRNGECEGPEL